MTAPPTTALLVLLDTAPGSAKHDVPFASGIHSTRADYALLLAGRRGWIANVATGAVTALPAGSVASNPGGYTNALEARIPRSVLGVLPSSFSMAAATGVADPGGKPRLKDLGLGANLANVAFRGSEPARDWWDKRQAFSLYDRTIDPFFHAVGLAALAHGATQQYRPGPGYHDRIFTSAGDLAGEGPGGRAAALRRLPAYRVSPRREVAAPVVVPLPRRQRAHRGGRRPAHLQGHGRGPEHDRRDAARPRYVDLVRRQGPGGLPRGLGRRAPHLLGRSRPHVHRGPLDGRLGHVPDVDPLSRPLRRRVPASGPVTQGAWTGVDFAGCDELHSDSETTPCYISANGGDPRAEFTRPLLDNLRWVPQAIYQGVPDELVPVTGVVRQAQRLRALGYRYRLYLFPAQEHYGPPVQDQWTDGARYEHQFVRDPNPPRVTYMRSMPFERAVETVQSDGVKLSFDFERAYWLSDLEPTDTVKGVARFDGRSLAIPERGHTLAPEAGGPATPDQTGPYAMTGQAWKFGGAGLPQAQNAFQVSLSGASTAKLDLARMRLDPSRRLTGDVATASALRLALGGRFAPGVRATIDGRPATIVRWRTAIAVDVPAGHHRLVVRPG